MPSPEAAAAPAVLVVGRLYCDLIFTGLDAMPALGRETFARGLAVTAGGGAFITAAWLKRLGVEPGIVSDLGTDPFSGVIADRLQALGLSARHIVRHDRPFVRLTAAMPVAGDRAFLTYLEPDVATAGRGAALAASGARHVHVAELGTLVRWPDLPAAARAAGMTVALDAGWDDALVRDPSARALIGTVDLFLPNAAEACALADLPETAVDRALDHWAARVPGVVVKCGGEGAVAALDGSRHRVPALAVPVVDATGAGDAFAAGLIAARLGGADARAALVQAAVCGSLAVRSAGGAEALPSAGEISDWAERLRAA
ncbi:MAG: carbohydrate kinase family protein [Rhodospirillales bacterium]